jgi:hypothetical protein
MLARSFRSCATAALATLTLAACASTTPGTSNEYAIVSRVAPLTPTSRVLDADRIYRSGATTAWDAIRLLVPSYRVQSPRTTSLRMSGTPDADHFQGATRLVIDGHQIRDLEALQAIPVEEIIAIHLLSATEAGTYFGPGSGGGAIVVHTRTMLRPR